MNIWPLIGLPIAFACLASLKLWVVFQRPGKILLGLMGIGLIWYGLILYHVPQGFEGWPLDDLPESGVLISYKIIEPNINQAEAGIYLWIVPKKMKGKTDVDLLRMIEQTWQNVPRAYKMPYDEAVHKGLADAATKADQAQGIVMFKRRGKKGGNKKDGRGEFYDDDSMWQVIRPQDLFRKEDQPEDEPRRGPSPLHEREREWSA